MSSLVGGIKFPVLLTDPTDNPLAGTIFFYVLGGSVKYKISDGSIYTLSTGVTPEEVEDIIGSFIATTPSIQWTYDDPSNTLTGIVLPAGVDHNSLANFVANKHIDHSLVSITAGSGLSGGGDLTASRTIAMPNIGTAGSYGSATQVAAITTDAQGRVSAAASTTIQIAESQVTNLSTDLSAKADKTTSINAGSGLQGGGDLSASRTISMPNVGTASTYGSATVVPVITTDAQGRVSSTTPTSIAIPSTQVTDFVEAVDDRVAALVVAGAGMNITYNDPANTLTFATTVSPYTDEQAQDAVGTILTDTASVDFTYNDAAGQITATVLPAGVNHDALNNFVANKHIDHSLVSITAGSGLSGGGDITASRTISMPAVGTAGSYGTAAQVPVITTDAQGRVSAVVNTAITGVPAANITNTPAGNISAINVQAALNELDNEKIPLTQKGAANGVASLDATGKVPTAQLPSYVDDVLEFANLASFPVTGETGKIYIALDTNKTYRWSGTIYVEISPSAVTSVFGRSGAVSAANGDYTASQVTNVPAGTIAAVTVQAALNELDTEKVPTTTQVIAGSGLTGGGALSANVTISMPSVGTSGTYGSATVVPVLTTDSQGRVSAVVNTPIALTSTIISDFNEAAQDAVGTILYGTPSFTFSYDDTLNTITGVVNPAGVDHNSLHNFVAFKHIDHSLVSVNPGTGLSGGGDLTASRTLNLANTTVTAGSYGSATQVPNYTVDAQGRLTAAANTSIQIAQSQVTNLATDLAAKVPTTRSIIAGTGLNGGGDLSADRTLNISSTGVTAASYGSSSQTPVITVNAQGQLTSAVSTAIDHNALNNFVTNKHIDHSLVSITAGSGLSGGGDLTASRTIAMPNVGTAGVYGDATHFPIITTDAQGRVSSVSLASADSNWNNDGLTLTWADQTGMDLVIRQANSGGSAYIRQVSSNGTLVSPTASTSGQRLGGNGYYGWNNVGEDGLPCVAFNGYATENHTSTAQGGEGVIEIIPNGSITPVQTAFFRQNGDLNVTGCIRVGDTADTTAGNIRYNGGEIQVRDATSWKPVAPVITSLTSTTAASTTSATFATIGSMTTTPAAGTYIVMFNAAVSINADSNGDFAVFVGAAEQTQTRRNYSCVASGTTTGAITSSLSISSVITVTGAQVLDVRFRENSSGTLTVNARELILIPIAR